MSETESRNPTMLTVLDSYNLDGETIKVVVRAATRVYKSLGPSFNENVYQSGMERELTQSHVLYEGENPLEIQYDGMTIGHREPDILVGEEQTVAVELKAKSEMSESYVQQCRSYVKMLQLHESYDCGGGVCINFPQSTDYALASPPSIEAVAVDRDFAACGLGGCEEL